MSDHRGGGISIRRSKLAIIEGILVVCKSGAKKTEIVYKSNLNFQIGNIYLQKLIDQGLVFEEGKIFKLTPRGVDLLSDLQSASALLMEIK